MTSGSHQVSLIADTVKSRENRARSCMGLFQATAAVQGSLGLLLHEGWLSVTERARKEQYNQKFKAESVCR